ncbi:aminoacyl-tRNA hydrolase [Candidatus Parcubacteria bacterium]|nr:aminoacyl-tRNA hydrolase [Candidatus Parcubacteria bacterium]
MKQSILIIGLGNPEEKYQKTRHNFGFQVIDEFRKKNDFPVFELFRLRRGFGGQAKKNNALISKAVLSGEKIILAKPQTFMNNSGQAVKSLIAFYKIKSSDIIVIHDDLDLPLGKIKISQDSRSAGHKGVQSIIDEIKTKNFTRFRLGIKPEQSYRPFPGAENFVLEKFTKDEEKIVKQIMKQTVEAIEAVMKQK